MEKRYKKVSHQLVDLGYNFTIKPDSLFVIEKLVNDLVETTENLKKYMSIAQTAVKECDNLRFGAEPYKCDNAKLLKECNDLHKNLTENKEAHAAETRRLQKKIAALEKEKQDYADNQKSLREKVRELELQQARKTQRYSGEKSKKSSCDFSARTAKSAEFSNAMALAEQKISNLTKQVSKLKEQQLDLCACNEELKNKLANRDKEINRLTSLLDSGRPIEALNNECCYQDAKLKLLNKQEEINCLQRAKNDLESKLKEARCKQHEAMKHALNLADKNAQLEKELKELDQMALNVEQECNNTIKNSGEKAKRLQERLQASVFEIRDLEKQLLTGKHERERLQSDLDACRIEMRHLQSVLDETNIEKKLLYEKVDKFSNIESDLNDEIDKLLQETAEQKRQIADLKGQLFSANNKSTKYQFINDPPERGPTEKTNETNKVLRGRKKSPPGSPKLNKSAGKKSSFNKKTSKSVKDYFGSEKYKSRTPLNTPISLSDKEDEEPIENNKENIDGTVIADFCTSKGFNFEELEKLKSERDFYVQEYKILKEQLRREERGVVSNRYSYTSNENFNFTTTQEDSGNTIKDLKEQVCNLKIENQNLCKEKHNLLMRLENVRDYSDGTEFLTLKSTMKRIERERDLLKADLDRLEEERNTLKHRIKLSEEMHIAEIDRYKKLVQEHEEQLRKLEKERYDILQNQGSRRATINNLEDQCDTLKEQLKVTQAELMQQKTIYGQLKVLHEQTDRALADSQNQIIQLESQLANYEDKSSALDNTKAILNADIKRLKDDIEILRKNLVTVEQEKDNLLTELDNKTEKLANAEDEIRDLKGNFIRSESRNKELRERIGATLDEKTTKEMLLKSNASDLASLKRELEAALNAKEMAFSENKKLQSELAACTIDIRKLENDLQIANRQIDDLKRQSQHYVAEVKRIEDLMAQKEVERSEMLDQFRNLSHEATTLENNNHHLETEAHQSKIQLTVALDHAEELEKMLGNQKSMVYSYEKQIAELTTQVATLEMKLRHGEMQQGRHSTEVSSLQELCAKLDQQKDHLKQQLSEKEALNAQLQNELAKLKRQSEVASISLEKELNTTKSVETILSETRRQLVEQQLLNEELRGEIMRLKGQVSDMEQNLLHVRNLARGLCGHIESPKNREKAPQQTDSSHSQLKKITNYSWPVLNPYTLADIEELDSEASVKVPEKDSSEKSSTGVQEEEEEEDDDDDEDGLTVEETSTMLTTTRSLVNSREKIDSGSQTNKADYKKAT